LAEERKVLGSQTARKGEGGSQRSGEAQWGWAWTPDSPQLPARDLCYPDASLSVSATFLFRSASCPILALTLLSHEASQTHGVSHMQPTEAVSSRSHVPAVRRVGDGSKQSFLAAGLAVSCWRQLPAERPSICSSASFCTQACLGRPLPGRSPLAQQGQPHPQLHQGLPQPIPVHILFNTLAQPHSYLMDPTWAVLAHSWSPS